MKKIYFLLLSAFAIFLLAGCSNKLIVPNLSDEVMISHLVDQSTQLEISQALSQAGISDESIQQFLDNVNDFNTTIADDRGLIDSGFVSQNLHGEYDAFAMQDDWNDQFPDFVGNNCRITSYGLINNLLTIDKFNPNLDNEYILFDMSALDNYPRKVFDNTDRQRFQTLYAPIITNDTLDQTKHAQKIEKYLKENGISIDDSKGASLIMVYFHDMIDPTEPKLFIGHIGVLVPNSQGGYFFIEKVAFQEPYQVIKFSDKKQMLAYLLAKYGDDYASPNESQPLVFENDKWLNN